MQTKDFEPAGWGGRCECVSTMNLIFNKLFYRMFLGENQVRISEICKLSIFGPFHE